MRGNPARDRSWITGSGSIPAHAGKPGMSGPTSAQNRVYPRPCGETEECPPLGTGSGGLSPPMRGNPQASEVQLVIGGSIPAHAGKPGAWPRARGWSGVYPRPCGETVCAHGDLFHENGSIPAHAGKPSMSLSRRALPRVYPRPCGETRQTSLFQPDRPGLSPPMRGNPPYDPTWGGAAGSIPAHAGKPRTISGTVIWCRVYPRPCGETFGASPTGPDVKGLSPPMRGNP